MAMLLRAKYTQHPQMAQTLLASGDAHIVYVDFDSYWSSAGERASNWIGRLLEVIRSELAAAEAGIALPPVHATDSPAPPGTRGAASEQGA